MSWLARSLATSLNIPEGDPGADDEPDAAAFWGVANFLAPPPEETSPSPSPPSVEAQHGTARTPPEIAGIRNDFVEIGGRFKSGISRISRNKAVSGFSRIASNFFAHEDDEEEELLDAARDDEEEERGEVKFRMEEAWRRTGET
ncbi:hypothetical protein GUJ93_ZPchr1152g33319 [Zizania palustris]|uniref:Uncharacterized protein n=1 Tax=Zizania palustris TaxID=103762 RepID=A0A8J5RNV2_ZIZPA|nr:hypothetical protein GUJ93_ZPchr1152g33319 [Zizania palustris]